MILKTKRNVLVSLFVLFYIKDNYKEKIGDVPKNYNKSFQLRVSGASNVGYTVKSGDSATVSSSG